MVHFFTVVLPGFLPDACHGAHRPAHSGDQAGGVPHDHAGGVGPALSRTSAGKGPPHGPGQLILLNPGRFAPHPVRTFYIRLNDN